MKRLTKLTISGLRNLRGIHLEMPQLLAIKGPNGSGKTSITTAIRLLVQGYDPELGKTLAATRKVMAPDAREIDLSATFDHSFGIRRRFIAKGAASMTEELEVAPPRGEVTLDERTARIRTETGATLFSFDLDAFLGLSAEKRKEMLFGLLPREHAQLDEERFRAALGWTEADDATRRAITHLWTTHVVANTSAVEGLAAAIEAARTKVNETDDDRRRKLHHVDELDAIASRSSEAVADFDSAEITNAMADLADVDAAIGQAREARAVYERACVAVQQHRARVDDLTARLDAAKVAAERTALRITELEAALVDTTALQEAASHATRKARGQREAVTYLEGQAQAATTELRRIEAVLAQLQGHETCPTCGSAESIEAARRTLAEQRIDATARATKARDDLAAARATMDAYETAERQATEALNEARRTQGDRAAALSTRQHYEQLVASTERDLAQAQADTPAAPGPEPDAVDSALHVRAAELRQRIDELRARERAAAKAERDREVASNARADLELLERKLDALKRLHRGLQHLRTEVIAAMVGPVEASANALLQRIDQKKTFQFILDGEGAKTTFDFGFVEDGAFRSFDAASTGEDAFLAIVFVAAMLDALAPAWPLLIVDNAESIDPERRRWMMIALADVADRFGNVIVAGCCDFADVESWQVVDMLDVTGARARAAA